MTIMTDIPAALGRLERIESLIVQVNEELRVSFPLAAQIHMNDANALTGILRKKVARAMEALEIEEVNITADKESQ